MVKTAFAVSVALLVSVSTAANGQAFSVPRSDEVIQVEVVLPGGVQGKVSVRDGTMLTVRDEEKGYFYGFSMAAIPKSGRADVVPLNIFNLSGEGQKITQFQDSETDEYVMGSLVSGSPLSFTTPYGNIEFRLSNIVLGQFPAVRPSKSPLKSGATPSKLQALYGKAGGGACCVSCYSITFCATEVAVSCGACSSGGGFGGFPVQ